MKQMKKILLSFMAVLLMLGLTGCMEKNVEGSLEEIMEKVYASVPDDERPMMLTNMEINDKNIESFLGTSDIEYEEALASESGVGSIAHSVILIRVKKGANVELIKEKLEKSVNPRKWICVEAEEVEIESKGNLIIVIMSNESTAEKIEKEFDRL